ncbi:MAG: 30S ribosomal protein S6 [Ignavibacteriaceae bacterium]|nr:30S ribosomal protein S6 [Ignavibacteriaceae bacterium]
MKTLVYESAVLINAALEDDQIGNVTNRIKETISSNGGEIIEIEDWGRKRLAYMVKKSKIGYYVIFQYNSSPDLVSKLERFFQLDENVLRYLTVKLSKDALEQMEQQKLQAAALLEEEKAATEPVVDKIEESEDKSEEKNIEPENIQ